MRGMLTTFFMSASFSAQFFTSPLIVMATFRYQRLSSISFVWA